MAHVDEERKPLIETKYAKAREMRFEHSSQDTEPEEEPQEETDE